MLNWNYNLFKTINMSVRVRIVVLKDTCNFDEWDAFIRAECTIQDCWEIITGTAPRPVQHPLPVVEEKIL